MFCFNALRITKLNRHNFYSAVVEFKDFVNAGRNTKKGRITVVNKSIGKFFADENVDVLITTNKIVDVTLKTGFITVDKIQTFTTTRIRNFETQDIFQLYSLIGYFTDLKDHNKEHLSVDEDYAWPTLIDSVESTMTSESVDSDGKKIMPIEWREIIGLRDVIFGHTPENQILSHIRSLCLA